MEAISALAMMGPRHLRETAAELAAVMPGLNLRLNLIDLAVEFLDVVEQTLDEHAEGSRSNGGTQWTR